MFPLSNVPSSLVTVWGIDTVLFQITVEPTVIVRGSGLKPAFVTVTSVVDGPGFGVGVGVSARVDTAVGVGVGFDWGVGGGVGASVGLASTICPETEGGGEGLGVDTLVLPKSDMRL